ncbi:uncharacterized protein [Aegilops tauschii subsp. strangulata]|uniref:uncharacterized protein n=1 Tax=Aegilops tauschii subsp. strangulata TaxID=200361 RepID=UPI003CC8855C
MESTQRLPEDVFAAVLRRLPPHGLAMARCVCKAWHATIDDRQLLHLFPPSLAGLFITFMELPFSEFFFRPPRRDGAAAAISGNLLRYMPPMEEAIVMDHCNGLLLLFDYVVNPATQRWAPLPPLPQEVHHAVASLHRYIVFDPAVSPHYEVVIVPSITWRAIGVESQVEWPPSPCIMHVFSSAMASWEERSFTRRGGAMGTVAHLRLVTRDMHQVLSAYWGGQLYVLNQFVMRVNMEKKISLGKSENGVYFASLDRQRQLRVWILNESHGGGTEWVIKHDNNLHHMLSRGVIEDINYSSENFTPPIDIKQVAEDKLEWDSDNDNTPDARGRVGKHYTSSISILGFHPYKEGIFLNDSIERSFAYHLSSSKLEDLGSIYPKDYNRMYNSFIDQSFPYTPCWIGELPGSQSENS